MYEELLLALVVGIILIFWMIVSIVLPIVAIVKTRRLRRDLTDGLKRLEQKIADRERSEIGRATAEATELITLSRPVPTFTDLPSSPAIELPPASPAVQPVAASTPRAAGPIELAKKVDWELWIGQRGLGWLAVIVLIFSVAFFLRYAFENQWIGALGRVATGLTGGIGLVLGGWYYHRRGWRVLSQMGTAAGLVLLYLATYASFAFYQLVPQFIASAFLIVLVVQSAAFAVRYNSPAIALMTLAGGLLTPMLLRSEQDRYAALFTYLACLNLGVMLLAVWRHWRVLGLSAIVGTHILFWLWYGANYHPEKLLAALCFQGVIFALFLGHSLAGQWFGIRRMGWPEIILLVVNPFSYFGAVYVLLRSDYNQWLGTVAIVLATAYVVLCRLLMVAHRRDNRVVLAALAVVLGFVALAFPIQADAAWVAMGWAAMAAALWWFGCRVHSRTLRGLAGIMALLAVGKLVLMDTPHGLRGPFVPIFNEYAVPALCITACILGPIVATRRFHQQLSRLENWLMNAGALAGILLLLQILSVETHGYFRWLAATTSDPAGWRWTGQMALSILWAGYASALLAIGMWRRVAALRWLALALFATTAGKVFLVDMATLHAFYRILAFLVLAVLLAVAARAYQQLAIKIGATPAIPGSES